MIWPWQKPRFVEYQVLGKNLTLKVASFQGSIWLTQKQLAEIFNVKVATINEHLKKIFQSEQFDETKLTHKFPSQAKDGKEYLVNHYHFSILEEIQRRAKR